MLLAPIAPVVLAGENSVIWLYDAAIGMIASASYWHADWSAAGAGSALFLWVNPVEGFASTGTRLILSDNPDLAALIHLRFNRFFPGCAERGFGAIPPVSARFSRVTEGQRRNRVVATGADVSVELEWLDPAPGSLSFFDNTSDPAQAYDVTSVICHCRAARIVLDGATVPGRVIGNDDLIAHGDSGHEPGYRSAFLGFAEAWVERSGPSRLTTTSVAPGNDAP